MKTRTKLLAVGVLAILLVSGVAAVLLTSNEAAASDGTPVVAAEEQNGTAGSHNLTVSVVGKVCGKVVPLEGANVTICMINVTKEGNRTTVVIDQVAQAVTDAQGKANFTLPEGKYFVFAEYNGRKGFYHGSLSEDQMVQVQMYHWNWGHLRGQRCCFDGPCGNMTEENGNCSQCGR